MTLRHRPPSITSILEARRVLGFNHTYHMLTKYQIHSAYVRSVKRYHPDGRHRPGASPCVIAFRKCCEAREILLAAQRFDLKSNSCGRKRRIGEGRGGFPFRTLRVLSMKQNLALRGLVMVTLAFGTIYDDWNKYRVSHKSMFGQDRN